MECALAMRISNNWKWRNDAKYYRESLKGSISALRWLREYRKKML